MAKQIKIKISELIPDDKNNNKHTAYGMDLLEKSVNKVGIIESITVSKGFNASRKIGKVHQNVLVFYKGNPKNIKANYPELDLSYINDFENEDN